MNGSHFDAITKALTRRKALGSAGAAVFASVVAGAHRASAQEATPPAFTSDAEFLFVQTAASGSFAPNPDAGTPAVDGTPTPGGGADFLLTLEGHHGGTIYFSDRPERIFGEAPTQRFLDGLGFSPANPPNAALVTDTADGDPDVLIVELIEPTYDVETGTITYGATILDEYEGDGLTHVAEQRQDAELPETFNRASLFIDDCPDADPLDCYTKCFADPVGNLGTRGTCWNWGQFKCVPCSGGWDGTATECNEQVSACGGECFTDADGICESGP